MRFIFILLLVSIGTGCSSVPSEREFRATTATLPSTSGEFNVDARPEFRSVFCAVLQAANKTEPATQSDCDHYLWRLADEKSLPGTQEPLADIYPGIQVYVIGGAFSECFGEASVAFGKSIARLSAAGVNIHTVPIVSRSGSESNARIIATTLQANFKSGSGPLILVGYSKGSIDILHFLAKKPELAKQVDAVVNIAGPVNGSQLADIGTWAYGLLLDKAFNSRCDIGDGGVLDSLRTDYRRQWLEDHPLPEHIHFYSLLAFTTREHIARSLVSTWHILANSDERNDGQLTLAEGTLAGSTVLAYANTDHWGIALDIEHELPFLAKRSDNQAFPRDVLFESVLRFVGHDH